MCNSQSRPKAYTFSEFKALGLNTPGSSSYGRVLDCSIYDRTHYDGYFTAFDSRGNEWTGFMPAGAGAVVWSLQSRCMYWAESSMSSSELLEKHMPELQSMQATPVSFDSKDARMGGVAYRYTDSYWTALMLSYGSGNLFVYNKRNGAVTSRSL